MHDNKGAHGNLGSSTGEGQILWGAKINENKTVKFLSGCFNFAKSLKDEYKAIEAELKVRGIKVEYDTFVS